MGDTGGKHLQTLTINLQLTYFKVQNELCRIYLNQSTCDSEKIENWSKLAPKNIFFRPLVRGGYQNWRPK